MSTRTERLSGELWLRYLCATLVTVIAAGGAQLVVRSDFVLAVVALSVMGAPVSLYLRLHGMRVAGVSIPRPLWNALTSLLWFVVSALWTFSTLSDVIRIIASGAGSQGFLVRFGAGEALGVLMQVFLLFSAFRSFALVSDKDATLATVPSFSVLLLLIPLHKGIEVVLYFLAWTLTTTVLFALDQRSELRRLVDGRVPAALPGQDVRMAARGLATVLSSALVAAFALSYFLTSRNPDDRSSAESAITSLVGRLAQFASQSSSEGGSGGPERQIDFSSGPTLPSKALLWRARVVALDGQQLRPQYFRLFTLARYDGLTWTPLAGNQKSVPLTSLSLSQWPQWGNRRLHRGQRHSDFNGDRLNGDRLNGDRLNGDRLVDDNFLPRGFAVGSVWPDKDKAGVYGHPTQGVRTFLQSHANNLGYVPLLPGTRSVYLPQSSAKELPIRPDGAIDLNFVQLNQVVRSVSDVPDLIQYGGQGTAPSTVVAAKAGAPQLSPSERAMYLQHPRLSLRLNDFAHRALASARPGESNFRRAQRLASAVQKGATYTLRPPTPPSGSETTDYFLFEGNKRGYCTHFASALAVLCRSRGIPARVVSGFAANEYDSGGWAMLREANAHAWTEVWVENWGWAVVDATPAEDRGDNAPNWLSLMGDWFGSVLNSVEQWSRPRLWLLGASWGAFFVGVYAFRRRARLALWWARRGHKAGELDWSRREIIAAYERAARDLSRRFRPRAAWETPDEWLVAATAFAQNSPRPLELALPQLSELTGLYLRALYAPEAPATTLVTLARELAGQLKAKKAAS
jgi:transglutaminase-like putative cysteine protease